MTFAVGSLVTVRGREWVVLPGSTEDLVLVRPIAGSEHETTGILTSLEAVEPATFDLPDPTKPGDFRSAKLLRDALQLGFRSTAGPFRSLGHISVEPRPYQLVPLLMALQLNPVRLLIADDVGIGKTIEAALIAKEMLDLGDIRRLAVLCPPHLAAQWQNELVTKFHISAELVLASTAGRLERHLPPDRTLFDEHPNVIVSSDFIKSDRRRDEFLRACPEFVIVDEAHACVEQAGGIGAHQRYRLVRGLAADPERHLVLVTGTPHSGKSDAFRSLIGLLDNDFESLPENLGGDHNRRNRERLARHLVQRRRRDLKRFFETESPFPIREEPGTDPTYLLNREYRKLFDRVLAFARETVKDPTGDRRRQRIRWWSALALLRALASSPAAAAATLRTRSITAGAVDIKEADALGERFVLDLGDDDSELVDVVPGSDPDEEKESIRRRLREMAGQADALRGKLDAKLLGSVDLVQGLLDDGYQPIVFCRFIDTAEYLAEELRSRLRGQIAVSAVTGRVPSAERERRVEELTNHPKRVLVATDCLSEGINLQDGFTAVFHYDLPWNPTRLEQREGRVDRFGQRHPTVRVVTYYGADNLIDRAVLDVLLTKHRTIRNDLGISIPVPGSTGAVMEAVSEAVLAHGETGSAQVLPGLEDYVRPAAEALIRSWDDAADREKASRSLFAQHAMKPEEVAEFHRSAMSALGSPTDVADFVTTALGDLGAIVSRNGTTTFDLTEVPATVRARLGLADTTTTVRARFDLPIREGQTHLTRNHPLVAGLAEYVLDAALDAASDRSIAARCGAIRTTAVKLRTTLLLSRFRFHITRVREGGEAPILAESAGIHAFTGSPATPDWLPPGEALGLLAAIPTGNVTPRQANEFLSEAIGAHDSWTSWFEETANELAEQLLAEHRSARDAAAATGRFRVEPKLPVDLLGVFVLLPGRR